jgi:hypothetical protein
MSPMRVGTLVSAAIVSTATLLLIVFSAGSLHGFGVPDNVNRVLIVASGTLWLGHLAAYLRDSVLAAIRECAEAFGQRVDVVNDRLATIDGTVADYGERQAAEGQVAALRSMAAPTAAGQDALGRLRAVGRPGTG